MRMMRKTALGAGASMAVALLAACSDSPMGPASVTPNVGKPSFAIGDNPGAPGAAVATFGKIIVCKTGNTSGSFNVSRQLINGGGTGDVVTSPYVVAAGTCRVVGEDNGPSGFGSDFTVTESPATNLTGITGSFIGREYPSNAIVTGNLDSPTNGATYTVNSIHGILLTFNNQVATTTGCTFTQGYYKNHENVVANILSTNGGYVVGNKLVVSADGSIAYTAGQIDDIFGTPPKGGNAQLILLHQLMTAELNANGGASVPAGVLAAINGARTLMNGGISAGEAAQAIAFANTLDAYNNGVTGPGHCG